MSRREDFAVTKNPPRSVGTVFDAIRNFHGGRGSAKKAAQLAHAKFREKRMKDALAVDFSKPYGKGA